MLSYKAQEKQSVGFTGIVSSTHFVGPLCFMFKRHLENASQLPEFLARINFKKLEWAE